MSILWVVLQDAPLRATRARVNLPQTRAAKKGVSIVPALNSFRKRIQFFGVAAAEHNVVGDERFLQLGDGEFDLVLPFFFAESFQAGSAKIIFNDFAIAIRQIAELERQNGVGPDKSRTEA